MYEFLASSTSVTSKTSLPVSFLAELNKLNPLKLTGKPTLKVNFNTIAARIFFTSFVNIILYRYKVLIKHMGVGLQFELEYIGDHYILQPVFFSID